MDKITQISTNEAAFILEGLKNNLRLSGRNNKQFREPKIKISKDEYGFVEVQLGHTKLAVRVSCEITNPFTDRPFEGIFTISTEISPMAAPGFENSKNSDDEILISRLVEKAIRRSNALDLESLCIVAGEKVWHIRADVNFIDYDGGFIDATCLGVMTALQHFRKPDVLVKGSSVVLYSQDERNPVPLSILHVPICVTYSFYNPADSAENIKGESNAEITILDADAKEESIRDGSLTITLNKNREVIQLSKNGGLSIDGKTLLELTHDSFLHVENLEKIMKTQIQTDERERNERFHLDLLRVGALR